MRMAFSTLLRAHVLDELIEHGAREERVAALK
jgi:hypothetical protein